MAARKQTTEGNATRPLETARDRYEAASTPAARARAAARLAHEMLMHDQAEDAAIALVEETEEALTPVEMTVEVRRALAKVHEVHAQSLIGTRTVEARRHVETGLALLGEEQGPEVDHERAWLWMEACEPQGIDAAAVAALQEIAARTALKPPVLVWIGIRAAELCKLRGDLARAVQKLDEAAAVTSLDRNSERVILDARGRAARLAGRLDEAETHHRAANAVFRTIASGPAPGELELAICAQLRADRAAALERAHALFADPHLGPPARRVSLECDLEQGRVASALVGLRSMVEEAIAARHDKPLHDQARAYVGALALASEAGALAEGDVRMADAILGSAEAVAGAMAGDDRPWYRVLFPAMHGEALALSEALADQGVVTMRGAYRRAMNEWPDAAPRVGRALVSALLSIGAKRGTPTEIDEALAVTDELLPVARSQRDLRSAAPLLAARVAGLARKGKNESAIRAEMKAFRDLLAESGAPRIAAEALLDLGRWLPARSAVPDPVALLDEAATLFARMPIPARQARCIEAAGDVLAARGGAAAADARYAEAEGLLARHDLGLALPALAAKRGRSIPTSSGEPITESRPSRT